MNHMEELQRLTGISYKDFLRRDPLHIERTEKKAGDIVLGNIHKPATVWGEDALPDTRFVG